MAYSSFLLPHSIIEKAHCSGQSVAPPWPMRAVAARVELPMKLVGHGIVAVASPWMAPQDAAYAKIQALQCSMFLHGLNHILRACGGIPAGRRQQRRYGTLIEAYGQDD